jgi:hypothetical protein
MAQVKVIPIGRGRPTRRMPLVGVAVLIVEDEPLIALDLMPPVVARAVRHERNPYRLSGSGRSPRSPHGLAGAERTAEFTRLAFQYPEPERRRLAQAIRGWLIAPHRKCRPLCRGPHPQRGHGLSPSACSAGEAWGLHRAEITTTVITLRTTGQIDAKRNQRLWDFRWYAALAWQDPFDLRLQDHAKRSQRASAELTQARFSGADLTTTMGTDACRTRWSKNQDELERWHPFKDRGGHQGRHFAVSRQTCTERPLTPSRHWKC